MKKLFAAIFLLGVLDTIHAQKINQVTPLDFMVGTWKGTGWKMTEKGKTNSSITEKVQCKLDCAMYVVEGTGIRYDSIVHKDIVVHDAFGTIAFDKTAGKWVLKAFKKEGATESALEFVAERKFIWSMTIPNGGLIRFTTDFSSGKWVETGEFSRDNGATWMEIMSMSLVKQD
jgi:hypothetical protein